MSNTGCYQNLGTFIILKLRNLRLVPQKIHYRSKRQHKHTKSNLSNRKNTIGVSRAKYFLKSHEHQQFFKNMRTYEKVLIRRRAEKITRNMLLMLAKCQYIIIIKIKLINVKNTSILIRTLKIFYEPSIKRYEQKGF